jgi:uncharacterized protein (DUF362 family)
MSTVYVDRCERYDRVSDVLRPMWDALGAPDLVANKRVLLKVNLTKGADPQRAVATHPAFARALAELVRHAGGDPVIGDSASIYGFTRETMDLAGYSQMSAESGIPCVPLDSGRVREVRIDGRRIDRAWFSEHVTNADVIVSVPKLKPHDFVELTGAVKNLFGTLPGAVKPRLHYHNARWENFLDVILDVVGFLKPQLAFIDGILAMEGQGPTNGTPKQVGLVVASRDLVAADAVTADLVGLGPIRLLAKAADRGLGEYDLAKIELVGPPRDSLRVPIQPAKTAKDKVSLFGLIKYFVRHHGVRPWLSPNPAHRDEIRRMADLCPTDAIALDDPPRVNRRCVGCMTCVESCAVPGAVEVKVPRWLHATYRNKAPGYALATMH